MNGFFFISTGSRNEQITPTTTIDAQIHKPKPIRSSFIDPIYVFQLFYFHTILILYSASGLNLLRCFLRRQFCVNTAERTASAYVSVGKCLMFRILYAIEASLIEHSTFNILMTRPLSLSHVCNCTMISMCSGMNIVHTH